VVDRSVSLQMTLNDPESQDARGQFLRRISLTTLVPYELERSNRQDNTCGDGRISRVSATPPPEGAGPQRSLTLRVPFYLCVHRLMQNYQIGRGNTRGKGVHFRGSATPPSQRGGVRLCVPPSF